MPGPILCISMDFYTMRRTTLKPLNFTGGVHTFTINYTFVDLANTKDYGRVETKKKS